MIVTVDRKMVQLRDGILGRKLAPNPRYFHIGFGGFNGLAVFGSTFGPTFGISVFGASAFGAEASDERQLFAIHDY